MPGKLETDLLEGRGQEVTALPVNGVKISEIDLCKPGVQSLKMMAQNRAEVKGHESAMSAGVRADPESPRAEKGAGFM